MEYKISIIVPVYNIEIYLEKCIESLTNQTYRNIEIILIDDGSTDGSGKICDMYMARDSRIRVIHKKNEGVVSARLCGAKMASGEYIMAVDGDDTIGCDRIQKLVEVCANFDADIIYMDGICRVYGDNIVEEKHNLLSKECSVEECLHYLVDTNHCFKRFMSGSQCLYAIKRNLYQKCQGQVNWKIRLGEDQLFVWLCVLNAKKIYVTTNCTYNYYQRQISASRKADATGLWDIQVIYNTLKQELDKKNAPDSWYKKLAFLAMRLIVTTDCEKVFEQSDIYLYPYSMIRKGSRLVVYAAGDMGTRMIRSLSKTNDYKIIKWIDKYNHLKQESGYQASKIESIYDLEYDWIVIAIADYDMAFAVKNELLQLGITEEKIAMMDAKQVSIDTVESILNAK